tara:strand:+ start:208 stop:435 length:228 start_codon:yes stop_codon:yes gene_type:complete
LDLYAAMQGTSKPKQPFRVEVILDQLPEDEADSLRAALNDPDVLTAKIAHVLTDHGYPVSSNAVSNYRRARVGKS